jgi:hypothetical protein
MRPEGEGTGRRLHIKGRSCGAFDVSVNWVEGQGYVEGGGRSPDEFLRERLQFGSAKVGDIMEWDWPGKKPSRSTVERMLRNGPFKNVNSSWTLDDECDPEED